MATRRPAREDQHGRWLVEWAGYHWFGRWLHHSPNEEMNAIARQKAAGQGTRPGFPDYFLPIPAAGWHGLFIELKRPGGKPPTETQKVWHAFLAAQGYAVVVAYGWEEAANIIVAYLERLDPVAAWNSNTSDAASGELSSSTGHKGDSFLESGSIT